ncbi:phage tail protein [Trinickia sp.]|uniref:phage tail protein n=1 Tax=Trinickia sp. TaxID=2571163 RepID=UPI003F80D1B7
MSDPYLGEIRMVGFNFAPNGWAMCQGQLLAISQNSALFSLLGTYYGGNGVSNFQLPNMQGRSPVGMGQGLGLSNINIGEMAGTENATLTMSNMPQHTHAATVAGGGAGTATIAIPASTSTTTQSGVPSNAAVLGPVSVSNRQGELYTTGTADVTLKPFDVSVTAGTPTVTNSMVGQNLPFSLRNPYIGINFVIALQGVFPSRG